MAFRIWSPGRTATGQLKPAAAQYVVGPDGCVPFVLAYYSRVIREFRYCATRTKILIVTVLTTRESVEYMWPSVRPLVPVS